MTVSYNWLRRYLDFDIQPEKVAEILTSTGLEVEKWERVDTVPGGLKGLVIGEVLEAEKHPNADKLKVTKVNVGEDEPLSIVCGAPNVAAGQKVVVATVGTTIHPTEGDPFEIKKAKIRGEASFGMICAEDEIGLGQSHDGIMELDKDAPVGQAAAEFFNIESDYIFEIGLTPNRADGNSHIGVARDLIAAINVREGRNHKLQMPDLSGFQTGEMASPIDIEIENVEACPRYSGLVISDVKVGNSPDWLRNALQAVGVKSINNIVDITNFVLFEYGQPLHAFDQAAIKGNQVIIKNLPEGTKFTTLDEVERKLSAEDLMICNAEGGMCIAGVFGGLHSGVTEKTTDVFFESAYFEPIGIRRTSTRHLLRTDAATHYEKGCDPNVTVEAMKRAALLMVEIAGGKLQSPITDVYPKAIHPFEVAFRPNRLNALAGIDIDTQIVKTALAALEIEIDSKKGDTWNLKVPTYRSDVTREADVIEEVLRIYGFDNIPIPDQLHSNLASGKAVEPDVVRVNLSRFLTGIGLTEIMTNSISQSKFYDEDGMIKLANSMTSDLDAMRPEMLPSGLEVLRHNINRQQHDLAVFEFGKTYKKAGDGFNEEQKLCIFLSGNLRQANWMGKAVEAGFFQAKGLVDAISQKLGLGNLKFGEAKDSMLDYGLVSQRGKFEMVRFGEVKAKLLKQMEIKQAVFYIEFNWDAILKALEQSKTKVKDIPRFPAMRRDLALLLDDSVSFEELSKLALKQGKQLLNSVDLFDIYRGDKIGEGKKSYAISLVFQDPEKTLTDKDVDTVIDRIVNSMEKELKASIRK